MSKFRECTGHHYVDPKTCTSQPHITVSETHILRATHHSVSLLTGNFDISFKLDYISHLIKLRGYILPLISTGHSAARVSAAE